MQTTKQMIAFDTSSIDEFVNNVQSVTIKQEDVHDFLEEYKINPTQYQQTELMEAYVMWNKRSGVCLQCKRFTSDGCKYADGHVEIHDGIITSSVCSRDRYNKSISYANLEGELTTHTFDNFKPDNQSHEVALATCKKIVAEPVSVLIYGRRGTGKTHLACATFAQMDKKKKYYNYVTLWRLLQQYMTSRESDYDIIHELKRKELIFVDDLGKSRQRSNWYQAVWYDIFEYRVNNNKLNILTSDLLLDDLAAKIGDEVLDRLRACTVFLHLTGNSYRYKQHQKLLSKYIDTENQKEV